MTNDTFHRLNREWADTEIEYPGEFMGFLEENYPGVFQYLNTKDVLGHFPLSPSGYEMQVVLKHWQKSHPPVNYRVSRVTAKPDWRSVRNGVTGFSKNA